MASVGCVAALNSSAKLGPHTKKHYFGIFQSKIQMQKDILRPYGVLNGKLIINNPKEIQCGGKESVANFVSRKNAILAKHLPFSIPRD